jgi:hypothetical protein
MEQNQIALIVEITLSQMVLQSPWCEQPLLRENVRIRSDANLAINSIMLILQMLF